MSTKKLLQTNRQSEGTVHRKPLYSKSIFNWCIPFPLSKNDRGLQMLRATWEFINWVREKSSHLFDTLFTIYIYPSTNKQLRRYLLNPFSFITLYVKWNLVVFNHFQVGVKPNFRTLPLHQDHLQIEELITQIQKIIYMKEGNTQIQRIIQIKDGSPRFRGLSR